MNTSIDQPIPSLPGRIVLAEIALVFVVFFVQGAVPAPEVNEPYYLGKAIHYWNPAWAEGDFFLESEDSHTVFYFTFGWLSLWLGPTALAWTGRILTWALLAWAWQRLSHAVVPRRWFSILSAALLVCLVERCHMAGEWLIGGVEAKGFAFVLVFFGLEALVRGRWRRTWLLLGAASAFHVLVGGWSVVAAGIAWLLSRQDRTPLMSMWPALLGGLLLSLPGLIPALLLNVSADAETVRRANLIYVYQRLYHHLDPTQIPPIFVQRFLLMAGLWVILCWATPVRASGRRLRAFVAGSITLALIGGGIGLLKAYDQELAAGLLRFYWFRTADIALPVGVALAMASFVVWTRYFRPVWSRWAMAAAVVVAVVQVGSHAVPLVTAAAVGAVPPADRLENFDAWYLACDWIAHSGEIPPDARFITPRMAQTFKWYTGRPEVANWKEIPQDALAIVAWWQRQKKLYAKGQCRPGDYWHASLAEIGADRLKQLAERYQADYVITVDRPRLPLERVYPKNGQPDDLRTQPPSYVIYRLRDAP